MLQLARAMLATGVVALDISTAALKIDFPQKGKVISVVVPLPAGGGNDLAARALASALEKEIGTTVQVVNRVGASGQVGTTAVVQAKPDGYTLIHMSDPAWVAYYYSKTYDTKVWEVMTPIGNLTSEPYGFVEVRAESPYKTWADLVRVAKENPGKLTCGGPGAGGMMELIMNEITGAAGVKTQYVPFAGAGPSKTALLGGHIDFRVCQPTEAALKAHAIDLN